MQCFCYIIYINYDIFYFFFNLRTPKTQFRLPPIGKNKCLIRNPSTTSMIRRKKKSADQQQQRDMDDVSFMNIDWSKQI